MELRVSDNPGERRSMYEEVGHVLSDDGPTPR